jgi:anti-sigma B factor antagonist
VRDSTESSLCWAVTPDDRAMIVDVTGEIDLSSQPEFSDAVRQAMDGTSPVIVLDLTEVTFMGSVGLRVLVETQAEAWRAERTLRVVVDGTGAAHRSLEISGLEQVLTVYTTLGEALAG